jgi:hypothetical protein
MNRFRKLVGLTGVGPRQINIVAPLSSRLPGWGFSFYINDSFSTRRMAANFGLGSFLKSC